MGFGLDTPPYQEKGPTQPVLGFAPCVGICPYPGTMSVPLFNLSMYINGPQTHPQLSVLQTPWGEAGVFPLHHWRMLTG